MELIPDGGLSVRTLGGARPAWGAGMKVLLTDEEARQQPGLPAQLSEWGYVSVLIADSLNAWKILRAEGAPRLALLDWTALRSEGGWLVRELRDLPRSKYVYLILQGEESQSQDLASGLEAGADDFLLKPYAPEVLRARLQMGQRVLDLQDQLLAAQEALLYQATRDSLTGVWNRGAILDTLQRELTRSRRERRTFGLVLADFDNFKHINDTYGHLTGDEVLREAARRMMSAIRSYDHIGRYGGEEFLIILPGCDGESTIRLAERLRERVAETPIPWQGQRIPLTVSLGAVVRDPDQDVDATALLHAADVALYRAKHAGRNQVLMGALTAGS
jgi:diguanylate cyclase (GGDEF)-like protein